MNRIRKRRFGRLLAKILIFAICISQGSFILSVKGVNTEGTEPPYVWYSFAKDVGMKDIMGNSKCILFGSSGEPSNSSISYDADENGSFMCWESNCARGGGFTIDINKDIGAEYTIGMKFSFEKTGPGWRKIIDYQNRNNDSGFYFYDGGKLQFYPHDCYGDTFGNNDVVDIIVRRKADTTFEVYNVLNGKLKKCYAATDTEGDAIPCTIGDQTRLGFFHDDTMTGSEATPGGKVYSIKIWDDYIDPSFVAEELKAKREITVNYKDVLSGEPISLQQVYSGEEDTNYTIETPSITGYTYQDASESLTGKYDKGNKEITLNYQPNTYQVTFRANDGTDGNSTKDVLYNRIVPDKDIPEFTNQYFTMTGWNTKSDGSGTNFTSSTAVTNNIDVYATWAPKTGNGAPLVTFDHNYTNPLADYLAGRTTVDWMTPVAQVGKSPPFNYGGKVELIDLPNWRNVDKQQFRLEGWYHDEERVTNDTIYDYEPVTLVANWTEVYNVSCVKSGEGTVTGHGTYDKGTDHTVTWEAADGHYVAHVIVDEEYRDNLIESGGITFENLDDEHSVTVFFEEGTKPDYIPGVTDNDRYYTIRTEKKGSPEAEVTPSFPVQVGQDANVTWEAHPGFRIVRVMLDDVDQPDNIVKNGSLTIRNVNMPHKVVVYTEPISSATSAFFTISTSAKDAAITDTAVVEGGKDFKVKWNPATGYEVKRVIIDGKEYNTPNDIETLNGEKQFTGIRENHRVKVICERIDYGGNPTGPEEKKFYIDTVIQGGLGTISSSGYTSEGSRFDVDWELLEDQHYKVSAVYVDGVSVPLDEVSGNRYAFENISDNHRIVVQLVPNLVQIEVICNGETKSVSKTTTMFYGEDYEAYVTPADGWKLLRVYIDCKMVYNSLVNPTISRFRVRDVESDLWSNILSSVKKNRQIHYVLARNDGTEDNERKYVVTAKAEGGIGIAEVSPSSVVIQGESATVKWTVDSGYYLDNLTRDDGNGLSIDITDSVSEETDPDTGKTVYTYKVQNISNDVQLVAELRPGSRPVYVPTYHVDTDFEGGTITPATYNIAEGENVDIFWSPSNGQYVSYIEVDGVPRPDLLSEYGISLVFGGNEGIDGNHKVFVRAGQTPIPQLSKEEKSNKEDEYTVNDLLKYEITAENHQENSTWTDVVVKDTIPPGLTIDKGSIELTVYKKSGDSSKIEVAEDAYNEATGMLSVFVGDICGGEKYILSFDAYINDVAIEDDTYVVNEAEATGGNGSKPDDKIEVNTPPVYPGGGSPDTDVEPSFSVKPLVEEPFIKKSVVIENAPSGKATQVGDILIYTIEAGNRKVGSVWKDVTVTDTIPEGLSVIPGSLKVTDWHGNEYTDDSWIKYDEATRVLTAIMDKPIYGNKGYIITFKAKVLPDALEQSLDIGNTVSASGGTKTDSPAYPSDDHKVYKGDVKPSVTKAVTNRNRIDGRTHISDVISYSIKAENTGVTSTWEHVAIRDNVPKGIEPLVNSFELIMPDGTRKHLGADIWNSEARILSVYVGDIGYNESYTFMFDAVVTADAVAPDADIGNSAYAGGGIPKYGTGDGTDPDPDNPGGGGTPTDPGSSGGGTSTGPGKDYEPGDPYFPDVVEDWLNPDGNEGEGVTKTPIVYPNKKDRPDPNNPSESGVVPKNPEPGVTKKVENETSHDNKTHPDDILTYTIELTNPKPGSLWKVAMLFDTLPKELVLDKSNIYLVYPNGRKVKMNPADVYNDATHTLSAIVRNIYGGQSYKLVYKAGIRHDEEILKNSPRTITNNVSVKGENPDGTEIETKVTGVDIEYPQEEMVENQLPTESDVEYLNGPTPNTGDNINIISYFVMFLCSGCLIILVLASRRKSNR